MIGAIGASSIDDIILFEVSEEKILTFDDFSRSNKVRYAKNDVLQKKPVSEYVGPDLDTISLNIKLSRQLGVDPKAEMDKLIEIQREGILVSVLIGDKGFGVYRWTVMDISMGFKEIDNKGNINSIELSLSFQEYI